MKNKYFYNAKILKVVDGDTVDISVDLGFSILSFQRMRLYGIDTKELRSKNPEFKVLALEAKQYLIDKILNKDVFIETFKKDKYGRYLVIIFYFDKEGNEININEELISKNLAEAYYGGKK